MVNLTVLERRLQHRLPSDFAEDIADEFTRFEIEVGRLSEEKEKHGQATLTDSEINRLNTTNQFGKDGLTVVEYQAIKGKAISNGITDWTSKVDSNLSYHENLSLMEKDNGY